MYSTKKKMNIARDNSADVVEKVYTEWKMT